MRASPLASSSITRHYIRGALGLVALIAALIGAAVVTPAALLLLIVSAVAWRGCPTCWTIGLIESRSCRIDTRSS